MGLYSTSRLPWTYSKVIRARSTTRWRQWDRLSVGETSASNLLTTIVPKSKDEDLVKASSRWCKRSAPLWHPDKWSTRLWKKLTDNGCMHPSSTRYSDRLVYGRSWPTTDIHIRHQRDTPTRWGLALIHCIRIMTRWREWHDHSTTIWWHDHYPRDFSSTTQGLDDSMACGRSDGATIRADVLDTTRGLGLGSTTWWYNGCYDDEMSEKATMQIGR